MSDETFYTCESNHLQYFMMMMTVAIIIVIIVRCVRRVPCPMGNQGVGVEQGRRMGVRTRMEDLAFGNFLK
ncbi:hypothetical protein CEXT_103461 [Caerostris extrusa]|uniref:Uncharacterized protein n=1 Tax=Caerostris extrusa TaxID=172846 RepID=A0AAV4N5M9_CAEEX|nr:hypothetical protein CEXT_103461 [Caerostris extrusa]